MSDKEYMVGIDLGTTYSCIAYMDGDVAKVEKNFEQEDTTPSVILFNDNGDIIIGSNAKDMAPLYPGRSITSIKRKIGTDYSVTIDDVEYTPTMLSGMILRKLLNDFRDVHDQEIKRAVITCPAYFGQLEREATKTAGLIAGLDDVRIINEPTAAAISFGYGHDDEKKRIMVYDLGGGTFDVTILEFDGKEFVAKSTEGERLLGGKDWDLVITDIIKEKIVDELECDEELFDDISVKLDLELKSEKIKKQLSVTTSVKDTLTIDGQKVKFTITREEFENASKYLIESTLKVMDRALEKGKFSIDDIDDIVIVGGSTRMPQVKAAISGRYPQANIKVYDPDQSVAKGAAIFASSVKWDDWVEDEEIPENNIEIVNVLSRSFGIKIQEEDGKEKISNIIYRNQPLPIVEERIYYPQCEGQYSILVEIYENLGDVDDGKMDLEDSIFDGSFEMMLPNGVTPHTEIKVRFSADEEGILKAEAECLGFRKEYVLENKIKMSNSDIEKARGLMDRVTQE